MLNNFSNVLSRTLCVVIFVQCFEQSVTLKLKLIDDYVNNELYLGMEPAFRNSTRRDCVWHQTYDANCSKNVSLILYVDKKREVYDPSDRNWLQKSSWDPYRATVVLVHGYASGDDDTPIVVLKGAYATQGGYNLFLVEYSPLSRPPCYVSNLNNIRYISRCVADYLNDLRKKGVVVESCIGHSLGAIICGALKKYLKFELNKIIGLDPALPLIYGDLRLKRSSAKSVHVLQTNAGSFGDVGSVGHVNVCVNGGLIQPYCVKARKPNLCSHIWAICYMAQSLFENRPLIARSCSTYCPRAGLFRFFRSNSSENNFNEIRVINNVPQTAYGTYCLDNIYPPYCPKYWKGVGDKRCCKFS
ncbi:phospholipase A1 member A-like [Bradysia coprophila]|uniref:phospholipase A1 member A-like n=1 Tax=Bradysia coprophila TaxID=38358 RepID=UPI00187D752F|nr:phospholipase A1 member A-like [Bradysia coprophila]